MPHYGARVPAASLLKDVPPGTVLNIALVGLPLSGKSTIINEILSMLKERRLPLADAGGGANASGQCTLRVRDFYLAHDFVPSLDAKGCDVVLRDCVGFSGQEVEVQLTLQGRLDNNECFDSSDIVQYFQRPRTVEAMTHAVLFVVPAGVVLGKQHKDLPRLKALKAMFKSVKINECEGRMSKVEVPMIPIVTMADADPNFESVDDLLFDANGPLSETFSAVHSQLGFTPSYVFPLANVHSAAVDVSSGSKDPRVIVLSHALQCAVGLAWHTLRTMREMRDKCNASIPPGPGNAPQPAPAPSGSSQGIPSHVPPPSQVVSRDLDEFLESKSLIGIRSVLVDTLGVTSLDDLKYLKNDVLDKHITKPVQKEKLLEMILRLRS